MADDKIVSFNYPLNGRLITKLDGSLLPDAHFQVLENLRYNDGGIEPIKGMTPINSSSLAKLKVQNGFHFKKSFPSKENHIFVQVTDTGDSSSAIYKSDNTTDIPSQDTFTLFKTLDSDNTAYFSEAPDQSMVFCDGYHNYVWSGEEYRCAAFMNFDPSGTFNYDYTDRANNNLTSSHNVFSLEGATTSGVDSDTKLLMHTDSALTDAIGTHTPVSFGWSNGSFLNEGFTNLTAWTDSDAGTGASTAATFDSRTTAKLTNGGTNGAGNYALISKDVGTLASTFAITVVLNLATVGTLSNVDFFEMTADNGDITLSVRWASDGLFVYDGSSWNEVGTDICVADTWQEYTFVVDSTTPASANVAVYLDDVVVDATVDCSNVTTATDGLVTLRQYGNTNVDQITYVDQINVGATISAVAYSSTIKFGTKSLDLNSAATSGINACVTVPDHADFNFSGGIFTIDTWFRPTNLTTNQPIFYIETDHATSTEDYFIVYASTTGAITASVVANGSTVVTLSTPASMVSAGAWTHIQVCENGNDWYIFINGVIQGYVSDAQRCADYTGVVKIGGSNPVLNYKSRALFDEFRISSSCRNTTNFTVPISAYGSTSSASAYIGSTRPIDGIKFYVSTPNTSGTATVTINYWNGSAWTSVGTVTTTDTEETAGIILSQSGSMTFTSTVSLAKPRIIDELYGYWYYVTFSDFDSTTVFSQVTLSAPVQDLVDLWDGSPRQLLSAMYYTTVYADYTLNAYNLDFLSTDAYTFMSIGGMTSSYALYFGFSEKMAGMKIYFGGDKVNANAATLLVDRWDGSAWTTVGSIVDGTVSASGLITFNKTGTVTWNSNLTTEEYPTSINNSTKLYYYRVRATATLSATIYIDNVSGIPAQQEIRPYRYPVLWQNRLFLLNDQSNEKNSAIGSSYGTVCVFNGSDSGKLTFGGSKEVKCGKTLFTRYGGSLYENLVVCKDNETYLVDGTSFTGGSSGEGAFIVYHVSGSRGCIAPLTMQQCDTGYEVAPGVTKHILAWLSNSGVIMFDSNSMIEISNDIGDRFFTDGTNSVNRSIVDKSAGFYDSPKGEYHVLIPTGTSTYLNEEWVYDVVRKKWYLIKRGDKYLWCGWGVEDSQGSMYAFGGTGDGFIERLENGTTFDGVSITYKFRLPDSLLNSSWENRKEVRQIKLVGKCKSTTTEKVAVSHYGDGSNSVSTPAITSFPNTKAGRRFYKFQRSIAYIATTHSFEFSITTDDEDEGFAPLFVGGRYRVLGLDMEEE